MPFIPPAWVLNEPIRTILIALCVLVIVSVIGLAVASIRGRGSSGGPGGDADRG
jgi:hypothetical protein